MNTQKYSNEIESFEEDLQLPHAPKYNLIELKTNAMKAIHNLNKANFSLDTPYSKIESVHDQFQSKYKNLKGVSNDINELLRFNIQLNDQNRKLEHEVHEHELKFNSMNEVRGLVNTNQSNYHKANETASIEGLVEERSRKLQTMLKEYEADLEQLQKYRNNSNIQFSNIADEMLEFSIHACGREVKFQIVVMNDIHRLKMLSDVCTDPSKLNKMEDDFIESKDLTKLIVDLNDQVHEIISNDN